MAPSVCDDPLDDAVAAESAVDCSLETSRCNGNDNDNSVHCDDTASLSVSFSDDEDGDGVNNNEDIVLHEPTDNELLLTVMTGSEVDAMAAVEESWRQTSNDVWGVKELRPIQIEALWHMISNQSLLLIGRTGIGKTHFVRMLGTALGGLVVVVVPLLALMGDQMTKMTVRNNDAGGSMEAYNIDQLDEENKGFIEEKLLPRIRDMKEGTNSSIFLFVSPYYLTRHPEMIEAIIEAHLRKVLAGIGIDEVHLYVAQSTFRMCIRLLKDMLWKRLFPDEGDVDSWPRFFAMTATLPNEYNALLQDLIGGGINLDPSMCIRPSHEQFQQRNINMQLLVRGGNNPYQNAVNAAVKVMTQSDETIVLIFTTLEAKSKKLLGQQENALNAKKCNAHVIHVSGSMDKHTKFTLLQLLNEESSSEKYNLRAMIATGAANTGIDLKKVVLVIRCGIAPDLPTLFQERGRLARESSSMLATHLLVANVDSVAEQLHLIFNPGQKQREDIEEQRQLIGANSAIFNATARDRANGVTRTSDNEDKLVQKENQLRPKGQQVVQIRERALSMLSDVLTFSFLDFGCQHVRSEEWHARGELREADPEIDPCNDSCPICRCNNKNNKREWDSIFHKLDRRKVVDFLESSIVLDAMPLAMEKGSLVNLLWKAKDEWVPKIFRVKAVPMYMAESAMLQLIAAKIVTAKFDSTTKKLRWILNRQKVGDKDEFCYKIDGFWKGVNLYDDGMCE